MDQVKTAMVRHTGLSLSQGKLISWPIVKRLDTCHKKSVE